MAKHKSIFACQECAYETPKWLGKCPECSAWNSFQEEVATSGKKSLSNARGAAKDFGPHKISEIESEQFERRQTGIAEFDRVVGGGVTKGSLTLLGGEPGIGKS
ncbi:MAG: DNA repair protein RadA, partial [Bacteriovoracaceae bacterium]